MMTPNYDFDVPDGQWKAELFQSYVRHFRPGHSQLKAAMSTCTKVI